MLKAPLDEKLLQLARVKFAKLLSPLEARAVPSPQAQGANRLKTRSGPPVGNVSVPAAFFWEKVGLLSVHRQKLCSHGHTPIDAGGLQFEVGPAGAGSVMINKGN